MITSPSTLIYKTRAILRLSNISRQSYDKKIKVAIDPVETQLRFEATFYGDWYSESVLAAYLAEKSVDTPESSRPQPALDDTSDQKPAVEK